MMKNVIRDVNDEKGISRKLTFGQTALAEQQKKFCEKERIETERPRCESRRAFRNLDSSLQR